MNMKQEKHEITGKPRRGAGVTEREFTVNEVYEGKLKLSDIFSDLLCAEYCRQEGQISKKYG